jgi:serine phosphatase RsbU (regulator of sigma subunit)
MALPAVVLMGISQFAGELSELHFPSAWFPFGVMITPGQVANLILIGTICVLLVRRLFVSVRKQRLMALDVKQAQELQKVILPEAQAHHPGLEIEAVFRPAREVGGDFFQVFPNTSGENLLIVAGDVAGKGLQAGMLVALTVGAIRTEAAHTGDPMQILKSLNSRLCGRGMATCLAMTIDADGEVTLANAGHIPPYRNGESLQMEGSLPLGVFEGAEPSLMHFRLEGGDRLVLMSDGVLEAMDADGQLFGFERIHALLGSTSSAADVADAAQSFGQEDDISVISVTRTAVTDQERPASLELSV